jgi:putative cardiolipin synthase
VLILIAVCAALQGCASLPPLGERKASIALLGTDDTRLGKVLLPLVRDRAGESGLVRLTNGRDAFAARMHLAEVAERSLDVQYYIWHNDLTGTLLFDALRRAADRGVRVRLLLDDNNTAGLAGVLSALAAHPNIEVRLFNPFAIREWRPLVYLTDFSRLNRRMHNKSFTADNQASIVGGRNVGDEYFGARHDILFVDLDVLAIGPVVRDISQDFDRYWNSESSYPADRLLPKLDTTALPALAASADAAEHPSEAIAYMEAVEQRPFVREMLEQRLTFDWAPTQLVSDDPAKALGQVPEAELLWTKLTRVMRAPTREVQLVSPYFVPQQAGVDYFVGLARQEVEVTIVTNSFEATDVPAAHSGYAKWRRALLKAGVALYEMKRLTPAAPVPRLRPGISSSSSLHGKTFAVDQQQLFIGSFNFDPRSINLNTELGLVIDSPTMTADMAATIRGPLAALAYRVRLTETGALQWVDEAGGNEIIHDVEPGTTLLQRLGVSLLSILPIDWLL